MATLFLLVGLPAAGKTTTARQLAVRHAALRLTPDDWMIPFEPPDDAELAGEAVPGPPPGHRDWAVWAARRWPSLTGP